MGFIWQPFLISDFFKVTCLWMLFAIWCNETPITLAWAFNAKHRSLCLLVFYTWPIWTWPFTPLPWIPNQFIYPSWWVTISSLMKIYWLTSEILCQVFHTWPHLTLTFDSLTLNSKSVHLPFVVSYMSSLMKIHQRTREISHPQVFHTWPYMTLTFDPMTLNYSSVHLTFMVNYHVKFDGDPSTHKEDIACTK